VVVAEEVVVEEEVAQVAVPGKKSRNLVYSCDMFSDPVETGIFSKIKPKKRRI
jgi:hypothetical protein